MIYLLLSLLSFWLGKTDAFLYSRLGAEALPRNEHRDFMIVRMLAWVAVLVSAVCGAKGYVLLVFADGIAAALAFSYWHNGAYYLMRHKIDGGRFNWDTWKYQSPTTTAKYDFNYQQRRDMLLLSLLLMAVTYALYFLL